jgi:hypothetical protein
MADASAALEFERAAGVKAMLDRLAELDRADYRHVLPIERFTYVFVHRGPTSRRARAFFAGPGTLEDLGEVGYPLKTDELGAVLARAGELASRGAATDRAGTFAVGLASNYLFTASDRRGVVLHWRPDLAPEDLAGAIEAGKDALKLKAPKPRASVKAKQAKNPEIGEV